ncbi:hypothetical protein U0027_04480 [Agrobacterium tumefaciens]|uniref:hypothetical protein n=1 Tax=Agrobacterium tumefaciens TaxID=358 RepID=UPI000E0BEA5A|nr:hypothetical protein [Agrobacterium tumefaciens]WQE40779.1 hypothetical protein U0027_04480 [Agrobacterium tumefaciens]
MDEDNFNSPVLRIRAAEIPAHPGRIRTEQGSSELPPGFIMLFHSATGRPLTSYNEFMKDVAVAGRTNPEQWEHTQKSYADDGANYETFLHFRNKTLESAGFQDLKDYAAQLATAISSQTGQPFADNTRRRRVGTIVAYYEWGHEKGYFSRVMPPRTGVLPAGLKYKAGVSKADKSVRRLVPAKPRPDEKVNFIPTAVVRRVLKQLGPSVDLRPAGGAPSRDRLIAESALGTGARLVSLVSVEVIDVLNAERLIDPHDANQILSISVRTKGRPRGRILVPQALLLRWLVYYRGERAEICRRVVERLGTSRELSAKLFLNHINSNDRDLGRAVSEDIVSRAFTAAMFAIGHTKIVRRVDVDEHGVPRVDARNQYIWIETEVAANSFHDLRHTYVSMTYHQMKKAGQRDPWKVISLSLDHALVSTTVDTYGKHVAIDESLLSVAMDNVIFGLDD